MNEMLNDRLAFDRYNSDIKRGESNYSRQAGIGSQSNGPRARLATALLNLATKLQPELTVEVQQPAQPATA
ncbi:hypothetical protein BH23CHL2_BH23CHL2_28380 [soil metagenome]